MKIAVLSDIHGNYPALETVAADIEQWRPDLIVVNGDTVNRGPRNLDCLRFVLDKRAQEDWVLLRGNHEDYVLKSCDPAAPQDGPEFEMRGFSEWTYRQLGGDVFDLVSMPDRYGWTAPDGSTFLVMHGSVLGNRIGIYPDTAEDDLRCRIAPGPSVFVTAHTHRVLSRQIDDTCVINIGSAGLPFDGDWRVSYGRFTWTTQQGWQSEIRRLEYDRQQAERDLFDSGFMNEAGPFARLILVELRMARGLIHSWAQTYEAQFLAGEITLAESVERFLEREEFRPYAELVGQ